MIIFTNSTGQALIKGWKLCYGFHKAVIYTPEELHEEDAFYKFLHFTTLQMGN